VRHDLGLRAAERGVAEGGAQDAEGIQCRLTGAVGPACPLVGDAGPGTSRRRTSDAVCASSMKLADDFALRMRAGSCGRETA